MKKEMKKVLITSMIGNALEWYDFVLFVQFAPFIGKLFFPSDDPQASLLAVFGVFAAGFIMRPIGGVLFGFLGDKFGRKISVILPILIMSVPTAFIGLLPTYSVIGVYAPIALTIIRLMQGIALGGGFSGCMTFLVEHSPKTQRGLIGSASMFSLGIGVIFGILISMLFSCTMSEESFQTWGWRLPFIASIAIGTVALYIRHNVHESPVYLKAKENGTLSKQPLKDLLKNHKKTLFLAIGIYLTVTVPFYTFSAYFNSFMINRVGFTLNDSMIINAIAIFMFMLAVVISGYLSDIFGRKKILVIAACLIICFTYPTFYLLSLGVFKYALIGQIIFGMAVGMYFGPIPAMLVEIFPTSIRFSGLSLSYNLCAAIFGGTTPYMYEYLLSKTSNVLSIILYLITFVCISLYSLYHYKDKWQTSLEE
jgi:MFS transporter, MHS family, proline/betaine transporter